MLQPQLLTAIHPPDTPGEPDAVQRRGHVVAVAVDIAVYADGRPNLPVLRLHHGRIAELERLSCLVPFLWRDLALALGLGLLRRLARGLLRRRFRSGLLRRRLARGRFLGCSALLCRRPFAAFSAAAAAF